MADTPTLSDFDLGSFTPYRLAVAAQKLSEMLARQYRDQYGVSIPEWRVMVHLINIEGASVRDIEKRVAMEKSKVSRAASRLEKNGYIRKTTNAQDRRLVHLALTEKGHALMAELVPLAAAFQQEIAKTLGETLNGLEAGLDKLLEDE